jgi:hypothetical protein
MVGLAQLVNESLARYGVETTLDHRRLNWSKWFRCESSFSVLLAPSQPGLFALGEEVIAPGEVSATAGKRMLALFQVTETDDLGMALGRLFLPGSPERERLASGRCFARYAVVEDPAQRKSAHAAFQLWLVASSDTASGLAESQVFAADAPAPMKSSNKEEVQIGVPAPLPSGF